jgi:hypothetical protein
MFAQRNLSRRRAAVYRCVLRWKHAVARDRFLQLVVLLLTITFVLILGACGLVAEARWYHSELVAMTSQLSRDSNELMNMAGKSSHWTIVSARQDRYAEATRHLFALHRELTHSETQLASHRDLLRNDAVMPFAEGLNVTAAARAMCLAAHLEELAPLSWQTRTSLHIAPTSMLLNHIQTGTKTAETLMLFVSVVNNFAGATVSSKSAIAADIPVTIIDNSDCRILLNRPLYEVITLIADTTATPYVDLPLSAQSLFDCAGWIMAQQSQYPPEVRFIRPTVPLLFAQSHGYIRDLAVSQHQTAYMFAHSDAFVSEPRVFSLLAAVAHSVDAFFGETSACMIQTNYDVLAVYFVATMQSSAMGGGYDPRLWYYGDNDFASRCHLAGMPIVTVPDLAPYVIHETSSTVNLLLGADADAHMTRREMWRHAYAEKWREELRMQPVQDWIRMAIHFNEVAMTRCCLTALPNASGTTRLANRSEAASTSASLNLSQLLRMLSVRLKHACLQLSTRSRYVTALECTTRFPVQVRMKLWPPPPDLRRRHGPETASFDTIATATHVYPSMIMLAIAPSTRVKDRNGMHDGRFHEGFHRSATINKMSTDEILRQILSEPFLPWSFEKGTVVNAGSQDDPWTAGENMKAAGIMAAANFITAVSTEAFTLQDSNMLP